ncbi:type VI secretion system protein ImpK [Caballeronia arationis]|jgi:type VI secretion system protein ImpK|uniref:Type VI secretion system protein ImpK n=1 Tax=Caballeronia arationis TaxID=1777142 RepID=A0A7Z7IES1_9BURK|nr:DotU family type IV/VI secretion system protein [Caballeronia arationis]SAK43886.1 type VI secretion system protein ImpK [Caballeronia arationis]SOE88536.1 type VI secretion system protein ImpK [Caballeronia arationis]
MSEASMMQADPPTMRALLRDTALEVSLLAQGGTAGSVPDLRARCLQLVQDFDAALEARQVPRDVKEDAVHAQCGLLDEMAMKHLSGVGRSQWDEYPLQVERAGNHHAGEQVYERLTARMRETPSNIELLECYAPILGLGFRGRYARDEGQGERAALIKALNAQIAKARPSVEPSFVIDCGGGRRFDWMRQVSPWALAGVACVVAGVIWFAWAQSLDSQLAHLLASRP